MFTIQLLNRALDTPLPPPPLTWTVEQLTWRAVGGPWTGRLRADSADQSQLWQAADWLRCGLTVFDRLGEAWWGYIAAVELHSGAGGVLALSLDEMANQVAVSYHERTPNDWPSPRRVTPWRGDADSMRIYGEKQRVFESTRTGLDEASAYAAALLARFATPPLTTRVEDHPTARPYLRLETRGWWETLDWRFYSQPRGAEGYRAGGAAAVSLGGQAAQSRLAQSFSLPTAEGWAAHELWLKVRRVGAPGDGLGLELRSGTSSAPGATVVAAVTLPAAQVDENLTWTRFPLSSPVTLQPGAVYWLQLARTGALDALNYYQASAADSAAGGYPRGALHLWNGSAWAARVPDADLHFQIAGVEDTGAQLAHLLAAGAGGQFLSGMRLETPTGISGPLYRDGSRRARAEVEDLLALGTSGGARLLARVEPDRIARIYTQPDPTLAALSLTLDGRPCFADGRALAPSEWPAGQWARLGPLDTGQAMPGLFIEACRWENGGFRLG